MAAKKRPSLRSVDIPLSYLRNLVEIRAAFLQNYDPENLPVNHTIVKQIEQEIVNAMNILVSARRKAEPDPRPDSSGVDVN